MTGRGQDKYKRISRPFKSEELSYSGIPNTLRVIVLRYMQSIISDRSQASLMLC